MWELIFIFVMGFIGGFYGTLVGGASLVTLPALIAVGLPPHVAIGTNRFGVTGLFFTGWYGFHTKKLVDYKLGWLLAGPLVIGAVLGAFLVFEVDQEFLKTFIAVASLIILAFVAFNPKVGIKEIDGKMGMWRYIVGGISFFVIGIYMGFLGMGGGTLLAYILLLLFGQSFLKSAGTRKIGGSLASLIVTGIFIWKGVVAYPFAISVFLGMSLGSFLGAKYSDKIGNVWIKRLFAVVVLVMVVKMLV